MTSEAEGIGFRAVNARSGEGAAVATDDVDETEGSL